MIEHRKLMQMPYLHIRSMFLSGKVLHRINSSQLLWNGLLHKKKPNKVEVEDILFFEKTLGITLIFLCTSWKFQIKQNSIPENLVKLCMLYPLEISKPKKTLKSSTPGNLVRLCMSHPSWNFKAKNQDLWKFHMNLSCSPLDIPYCF